MKDDISWSPSCRSPPPVIIQGVGVEHSAVCLASIQWAAHCPEWDVCVSSLQCTWQGGRGGGGGGSRLISGRRELCSKVRTFPLFIYTHIYVGKS